MRVCLCTCGIHNHVAGIGFGQRVELNCEDVNFPFPHAHQAVVQGMSRADFRITVRSDDEVPLLPVITEQDLQQIQGRGVRPLQVIQKHHQRTLPRTQGTKERLKHTAKPVQGGAGLQPGNLGLGTDDLRQYGQHIHHNAPVGTQRRQQVRTQGGKLFVGIAEVLAQQRINSPQHRRKRLAACKLIKLAHRKLPAPRQQGLAQFCYQCGLANATGPSHQQQCRAAAAQHGVERIEQLLNLGIAPVHPVGNFKSKGWIA